MPQDPQKPSDAEYERLARAAQELRATKAVREAGGLEGRERGGGNQRLYLRYTGLGLQMLMTMLAPGALGWWLDSKFGSFPWLLVAGAVVGVVVSMAVVVRTVMRMEGEDR
jgi:F0F1-type ATP synthase assembly protein I